MRTAERRGFSPAADPPIMSTLRGLQGAATAVTGGFPLHAPEEKEKAAATERLRGAANVSPHISVMYRLMDDSQSAPSTPHQMLNYSGPDAHATETKIVCRADVFPTFCACTPFLVSRRLSVRHPKGQTRGPKSRRNYNRGGGRSSQGMGLT